MKVPKHDLYKDGDENIPEVICDGNGQVVLSLCKVCNRAESELDWLCGMETELILPPIPTRQYDWRAYFKDHPEGPYGYGETEAEAIAELKDHFDIELEPNYPKDTFVPKTLPEEQPDKYHRHHEIHEGNCVTCYTVAVDREAVEEKLKRAEQYLRELLPHDAPSSARKVSILSLLNDIKNLLKSSGECYGK